MNKIAIIMLLLVAPAVNAESDWNFRLTPYAWFAGVKGNASTIPGAPVVPIEVSPSEALSDSQVSAMLIFEAKQNQHGVLVTEPLLFTIIYISPSQALLKLILSGATRSERA